MAALLDLNESTDSDAHAKCDVCVIGAGAAGLYLANRLSRDGLRVVVLEAGGARCDSGAAIGIEPLFTGTRYRGALEGRAFGWGGTTSRWGGLLVPYSELDLRCDASFESIAWKHIVEVVRARGDAVLSSLGLQGDADFLSLPDMALGRTAKMLHDCGLKAVAADFLPFRKRNLTFLSSGRPGRSIVVYLNAVATRWVVNPIKDDSGIVITVDACSQNGRGLRVSAGSFVIAAGAIESARILLEIDRSTGERVFPGSAAIGQYLSDHLSCSVADVHPEDRILAARLFRPIFRRGRLRSFRFVEHSTRRSTPRHFSHLIFDNENPGFRLAKEVMSSLQSRSLPNVHLSDFIGGISGLSRLAYDRFVKSTLFIPKDTPVHLQLDVEQAGSASNRVSLGDSTDRFGRPVAVVHWRISEADNENVQLLSRRILGEWPDCSFGFPRLIPILVGDAQPKPHDAYHPVGTCRMGTDKEATVDLALRVRGTLNLYVLSTGVFPSAGSANPTFSMLCLADQLASTMLKQCLLRNGTR